MEIIPVTESNVQQAISLYEKHYDTEGWARHLFNSSVSKNYSHPDLKGTASLEHYVAKEKEAITGTMGIHIQSGFWITNFCAESEDSGRNLLWTAFHQLRPKGYRTMRAWTTSDDHNINDLYARHLFEIVTQKNTGMGYRDILLERTTPQIIRLPQGP